MTAQAISIRTISDVEEARRSLTRRRGFEEAELSEQARESVQRIFGKPLSANDVVARIIRDVRMQGDTALMRYSLDIDRVELQRLEVPKAEWAAAYAWLDDELRGAMLLASQQIRHFHERQRQSSWIDFGAEGALGQLVRPLERIGVYAPGGSAVYPSSVLMTVVPARVAGVEEIVICSPPTGGEVSGLIMAAAHVAGADRLFQVGGAQAIAAMAYGTESVPHVDKIFGPGNIFVILAKQQVYGVVAIDQLPGPTETLVIADETADARVVAADLLAQAEHDPMASAILITTSHSVGKSVWLEIGAQIEELERKEIVSASLANNGLIIVVPSVEIAIELANAYAPEHLCLLVNDPWPHLSDIKHAGGVFVGESSPEALADYAAGPSHVMPTGGSARFFSTLHLADFTKVISLAAANDRAMGRLGRATIRLAEAEGLTAHARAIKARLAKRPDLSTS